ncbi:MAG: hypothetical protein LBM75_07835, partial [Myxococcales bacterium]|nr:hypothetical protein [Myxococcales bacterium]
MPPPAQPNFLKAAFQTTGNAIVLALSTLGLATAIHQTGESWMYYGMLPGIELLYLGITSSLPGFRRKVRARHEAELKEASRLERQKKLDRDLAELSANQRACFLEMKSLTD